jgi:hypothetical protein
LRTERGRLKERRERRRERESEMWVMYWSVLLA